MDSLSAPVQLDGMEVSVIQVSQKMVVTLTKRKHRDTHTDIDRHTYTDRHTQHKHFESFTKTVGKRK